MTQRYLAAAAALGKRPTQLHDPLARVLLVCPEVDPKVAARARRALAGQHEEPGSQGSVLRTWRRRKEG